jgi:hypothetical protein
MTQTQSAVRIDSLNIDAEIQKYESELEDLIQLKETALKKEAGFNAYLEYLATLEREYGVTEEDLFSRRSVKIGDWITKTLVRQKQSALLKRLAGFFEDYVKKQPKKTVGRGRPQPAKALETGVYRHPMSLETVEKKTRAPKLLNAWIHENGLEKVQSWRVAG